MKELKSSKAQAEGILRLHIPISLCSLASTMLCATAGPKSNRTEPLKLWALTNLSPPPFLPPSPFFVFVLQDRFLCVEALGIGVLELVDLVGLELAEMSLALPLEC